MSENNKKADEVFNRWIEEEQEAKKKAIEERTESRLRVNDKENKEAFLSWLKNRIESNGYTIENVPEYMGAAFKSGNPQDLNQLIWQEWYEFNNPNDVYNSLKKSSDSNKPKYKYRY